MKKIFFCVILLIVGIVIGKLSADLITQWVGPPMVQYSDESGNGVGAYPGKEIGFRSDGVVVWREVQK